MSSYGQHFSTLQTPQAEKAAEGQSMNNAGGYSFTLDCWKRLDRFLILGAEGGTYYVGERKLTIDNARGVQECLRSDGMRTVRRIVEVSDAGRAPKNDPAIFALAMAAGDKDPKVRASALAALPKVCRIGTHLFSFVNDVEGFRRWGRGLRSAVSAWYNDRTAEAAAFQIVKYGQRGGWSHRDVLRKAHPKPPSASHEALYRWTTGGGATKLSDKDANKDVACGGAFNKDVACGDSSRKAAVDKDVDSSCGLVALGKEHPHGKPIAREQLPRIIEGFMQMKVAKSEVEVIRLLRDYRLPHECIEGEWKKSPKVWEALLPDMGLTALLRNLGRLSAIGLLGPLSATEKATVAALSDAAALRKARVHPMAILIALSVYGQGHGDKGKLSWQPSRAVLDALDAAFYQAFDNVVPTGKNHYLAIDISGSMDSHVAGCGSLTARQTAAAMAMVTARTEANYFMAGFTSDGSWYGARSAPPSAGRWSTGCGNGLTPITFGKAARLDAVCDRMAALPMGGTDCSLPIIHALETKMEVDAFHVYTDNETWAGTIHPHQALERYRQATGRNARLIVVGMTATEFTIADSSDAGMLDVVGFDAAAPAVMADFVRD